MKTLLTTIITILLVLSSCTRIQPIHVSQAPTQPYERVITMTAKEHKQRLQAGEIPKNTRVIIIRDISVK